MKRLPINALQVLVAAIAAASVVACAPKAPAPVAAAPAVDAAAAPAASPTPPPAASISLSGKWAGTITCYKIGSPLQMTIDAAKPGEAVMSKGDGGALSWSAQVTLNDAARLVTITAIGAADGAERVEGRLSDDGAMLSGVMDKQLCTDFKLTRQP
jgi:hypothetical protein